MSISEEITCMHCSNAGLDVTDDANNTLQIVTVKIIIFKKLFSVFMAIRGYAFDPLLILYIDCYQGLFFIFTAIKPPLPSFLSTQFIY